MALTERVMLLGKGLYETIPDELTIKSIPTASELEYASAEDFDRTVLEKILPSVVEGSADMNFMELLDIDYDWLCRCLRIKSYGPYFTTNRVWCPDCGEVSDGEYVADLRNVGIDVLPEGFVNHLSIDPEEFIDFDEPITFHLLSAGEELTLQSDKLFDRKNGGKDIIFGRICYMIDSIGKRENITPVEVRSIIKQKFSSADYKLLDGKIKEMTSYGLQKTGNIHCPKCASPEAFYIALQSDKFFRPTVGDVKRWKSDIRSGKWQGLLGNPAEYIRVDS